MSVKSRLAMWESSSTPLTPEAQYAKIRASREQQKQQVKVARARAARYNMTLRAISIRNVRDQADMKQEEVRAVQEAKRRAEKFNMTSRALGIVSARNQQTLAAALDESVSSGTARRIVEAAAMYQAAAENEITNPRLSNKQRFSNARRIVDKSSMIELSADNGDKEEEVVAPKRVSARKSTSSTSSSLLKRLSRRSSKAPSVAEPEEEEDEQEDAASVAKPESVADQDGDDADGEDEHDEDADKEDEEEDAASAVEVEEIERASRRSSKRQSQRASTKRSSAKIKNPAILPSGTETEDETDVEYDDEGATIVMGDLAKAVAQGDEDGMNRAILKDFLKQHAPERLDEVDDLLQQYEGSNMDTLFQELMNAYPDSDDDSGQDALEKAMKEAMSGGEDEDEDENVIERQRREKEEAEAAEAARQEALSKKQRAKEEAEAKAKAEHEAQQDKMLKEQLDVYAKTNPAKKTTSEVIADKVVTEKAASKRLSKSLERASASPAASPSKPAPEKKKSIAGGFILSASIRNSGSRPASERASVSSKWAVNVQPRLLRERMRKAGVAEKDIEALMSEESDML